MGALSPNLVVFLVILAAGAAVALGYSISWLFTRHDRADPPVQSQEQTKHMREVRQRNYDDFWDVARAGRHY